MPTDSSNEKPFYLGLCMAGAVSAGSYTAGVMDYLLEALTEWEKRRNQDGVPQHKVQIPVMGGASAGGMTAIMATAELNTHLTPIDKPSGDILADHPENKLYHSWVDLTDVDMLSKLLDTSDIKTGKIVSGLNSGFIDAIAQRVVTVDPITWQTLPKFISPGLKVFTTLTNLEGFDYEVDFGAGKPQDGKYHMEIHNDYACFQLADQNISGNNGGWMPLNFKEKINTEIVKEAAMATGAFPIGLKSRQLNRDALYVNNNPWLKDYLAANPLPNGNYNTLNVDGGLINNEPFEKVRNVLDNMTGQTEQDNNDFNKFTSTVLMIEPFPTKKQTPISKDQSVLKVIGLTLPAMISQMRSKPVNISDALNKNRAGQFLITPSRKVKDGNEEIDVAGEYAIACGALDGFSGFINKEFRVHDYFLGRYNCKIFLRDYFTVPETALENNEIFKQGYMQAHKEKFKSTKDNTYQIIPVFADSTDYTFPDFKFNSGTNWPVLEDSDIDKYKSAIKARVQAVLLNIIKYNQVEKFLIWSGSRLILNRLMANAIISKIKSELSDWKLLSDN